jgi:hypothetical protein
MLSLRNQAVVNTSECIYGVMKGERNTHKTCACLSCIWFSECSKTKLNDRSKILGEGKEMMG